MENIRSINGRRSSLPAVFSIDPHVHRLPAIRLEERRPFRRPE